MKLCCCRWVILITRSVLSKICAEITFILFHSFWILLIYSYSSVRISTSLGWLRRIERLASCNALKHPPCTRRSLMSANCFSLAYLICFEFCSGTCISLTWRRINESLRLSLICRFICLLLLLLCWLTHVFTWSHKCRSFVGRGLQLLLLLWLQALNICFGFLLWFQECVRIQITMIKYHIWFLMKCHCLAWSRRQRIVARGDNITRSLGFYFTFWLCICLRKFRCIFFCSHAALSCALNQLRRRNCWKFR